VFLEKDPPDQYNDQPDQEYENGKPVDAVHVFDKPGTRRVRVLFFKVKVLSQLPPYAHNNTGLFGVPSGYSKLHFFCVGLQSRWGISSVG
jgi:hypothetical protein